MPALNRRGFLAAGATLGAAGTIDPSLVHAQGTGTLRIAMTAADIPLPNGQTDQGAEGMRFVGYTLFDSLVEWDLSSATKLSGLLFVAHDVNPRSLAPRVKGFVQAQNWFQDLTPVVVG